MRLAKPTASVSTFYSYKGGVGRTLVMANVGLTLARWGYRVLLVDWDLEAPGLHEYLRELALPTPEGGIVDLLEPSSESPERDWRDFAVTVQIPKGDESFDFLPAGGAVEDYVERAQRLDFRSLYEQHDLGRRIDNMRSEWKDSYDIILIDSRTGASDVGSICTVQLPDILCLCFTTNRQSLYGGLDVARRANTQRANSDLDRGRLLVIPILSRFEANVERALSLSWEQQIAENMTDVVRDWLPSHVSPAQLLPHLRVPYVPVWSLGEGMPTLEEDGRDPLTVSYAVETIAALIARGADEPALLLENRQLYVDGANRAGAAGQREARQFSADFALIYDVAEAPRAQQLASALRDAGFTIAAHTPTVDQAIEDLNPEAAAAQHVLLLIGDTVSPTLEAEYRRLVLGLFSSDAPRMLIPILLTRGARDALPMSFRTLQQLDASDITLPQVVQQVSAMIGRLPPSSIQGERDDGVRVDVASWFVSSRDRFNRLLADGPFGDRYQHGVWSIGYAFEPAVDVELGVLREALRQSQGHETGWPEWMWPEQEDVRPRVVDDLIECWMAREGGAFGDSASSDFWRAAPDGKLYLLRGYQEDSVQGLEPGTAFDFIIPIWRVSEAFLHASRMSRKLGAQRGRVRLHVQWEGLRGRRLVSLDPSRHMLEHRTSAQDTVTREIAVPIEALDNRLASAVYEMLKGLYQVFDFFELSYGVIEETVGQVVSRAK